MTAAKVIKTHGTPNYYRNHGCRCDECKAANTLKQREYVAKKRQERVLSGWQPRQPKPDKHGTEHQYKERRCRCDACKTAHAAAAREYRKRRKVQSK